jgi:hypothetical protein
MKMEQCVPKRWHLNYRRRGITQKKAYDNLWMSTVNRTPIIPRRQLSASSYRHSSPTRHKPTLMTLPPPLLPLSIRQSGSPSSNCSCSGQRHVSCAHIRGFILAKVPGSNPDVHYPHMFMVVLSLSTQITRHYLNLRHNRLLPGLHTSSYY